jgi:hypothetical protein
MKGSKAIMSIMGQYAQYNQQYQVAYQYNRSGNTARDQEGYTRRHQVRPLMRLQRESTGQRS